MTQQSQTLAQSVRDAEAMQNLPRARGNGIPKHRWQAVGHRRADFTGAKIEHPTGDVYRKVYWCPRCGSLRLERRAGETHWQYIPKGHLFVVQKAPRCN